MTRFALAAFAALLLSTTAHAQLAPPDPAAEPNVTVNLDAIERLPETSDITLRPVTLSAPWERRAPAPQVATAETPTPPAPAASASLPGIPELEPAASEEPSAAPATETAALPETPPPAAAPAPPPQLSSGALLARITFTAESADLSGEAKASLDALAAQMKANNARVHVEAFAGAPGDTSSAARRNALRRALAVRTYLGSQGIDSSRVDVRALGGAPDGPADRVDVKAAAG